MSDTRSVAVLEPRQQDVMQRMLFVTGFARGGTSWLRDCIGSHPEIAVLPRERVVFRDMKNPEEVRAYFGHETEGVGATERFIVNKAPANAPALGRAARAFPESRFIFIIRDPRDVLVSHQRGNKEWMKGRNSTVDGCMEKIQDYFGGWQDADGLPNVHLVRYEDLHQDFHATMRRIFDFIGLDAGDAILNDIFAKNNFAAQTARANVEDPNAAKRKGVIGEWATHLKPKEVEWYGKSPFYSQFLRTYDYDRPTCTYANIVKAMHEGGAHFLSEDDLLQRRLDPDRPNIVLQHDIDYLNRPWCFESVKKAAEVEAALGLPAAYNFLPLDDSRYTFSRKRSTLDLMKQVLEINPRAYLGLHVNACERFYPASAPNVPAGEEDLDQIRAYLHKQVDDYLEAGIRFNISTSHGYGRGKKLPNNRDTAAIGEELAKRDILLFDTTIRPVLVESASHGCALTDVGGMLKPRRMGNGFALTDPRAYSSLPKGSFLRYLTHPGNYPTDTPSTVTMRVF